MQNTYISFPDRFVIQSFCGRHDDNESLTESPDQVIRRLQYPIDATSARWPNIRCQILPIEEFLMT